MLRIIWTAYLISFLLPRAGISADISDLKVSDHAVIDTESQRIEYEPDRPCFPTIEMLGDSTKAHSILGPVGINVYTGIGLLYRNSDDLNDSFYSMESSYGYSDSREFDGKSLFVSIGLRIRFDAQISALWDFYFGGNPDDNTYSQSSVGLSGLYSLSLADRISLSVGPGLAFQRIKAKRHIYVDLGDNAYLESITLDSGNRISPSAMAMLEFRPEPTNQRFSIFILARHVFGQSDEVNQRLYRSGSDSSLKIDMSETRILGGFGLGF